MATESSTPFTSAETPLPPLEPTAISATPTNEITAEIQKRESRRSSPTAKAISAAKIGVAPSTSATVVAVVNVSE